MGDISFGWRHASLSPNMSSIDFMASANELPAAVSPPLPAAAPSPAPGPAAAPALALLLLLLLLTPPRRAFRRSAAGFRSGGGQEPAEEEEAEAEGPAADEDEAEEAEAEEGSSASMSFARIVPGKRCERG